ncbi:hypothetical protein ACOSP7_010718 [Xanthoceras sorbifolium]
MGVDKNAIRTGSTPRPSTENDQSKKLFLLFDTDHDGRLSKQELINSFYHLALNQADLDGDGYISEYELDDLVKFVLSQGKNKKQITGYFFIFIY